MSQGVKQQQALLDRIGGEHGSKNYSKEDPCSCVNNRAMTTEKMLYW